MTTTTTTAAAAARSFKAAAGASIDSTSPAIRVVTYNILAEKFAVSNFMGISEEMLSWPSREPRLLSEIASYKADVLCLQEVERPFIEQGNLGKTLNEQGFEWMFYGRRRKPSDPVPGPEEGVCLAYNTCRFERIAWEPVRLANYIGNRAIASSNTPATLGGGGGGGGALCLPPGAFRNSLADREDGAVLALLRDKSTETTTTNNSSGGFGGGGGRHVLACCTHLFWNPRHPDIKAAQAHLLCVAIRDFLSRQRAHIVGFRGLDIDSTPVLIGGDFNSLPSKTASDAFDTIPEGGELVSGAYTCLVQGAMPIDHPDHPSQRRVREAAALRGLQLGSSGVGLKSAAKSVWGKEPPFTNRVPSFSGCLDYVFYSPRHFEVAAALEMPFSWQRSDCRSGGVGGEDQCDLAKLPLADEFPAIPDEIWPSDHLALGFDFKWRSNSY